MNANIAYGHMELQNVYRRNILLGMITATLIVLSCTQTYRIVASWIGDDAERVIRCAFPIQDLLPPPLYPHANGVRVSVSGARPSYGIPVPVPDPVVGPDATIATKDELAQAGAEQIPGNGGVFGVFAVPEDPIPAPETFIPHQSDPYPLSQPVPAYPELAQKVQLEGNVWVKVFVDKEGIVRRAIVMKSDAEILEPAALSAASKWIFRPALMNNRPVAVWVAIPFRFRLRY